MRRWLLLLLGGTLVFGLLCFASGLLLGIHLAGVELPSPHLPGNQQAGGGATAPAAALPAPPAAALSAPTVAVQPGGAQNAALPAAAQASTPSAPTTPGAQAAPAGGPSTAAQKAGSADAGPTSGGGAAGQGTQPVQPVVDLLVGAPADEEAASPLRGPLVSTAVQDQPAPKQPASSQTPGSGSPDPAAGTKAAANPGAAGSAAPKPMPNKDGGGGAPPRLFAIRIGAYLDVGAAQRRAGLLINQGYHPLIVSSQQAGEGLTWYSVVLDPSKDPSSARREATQLAGELGQQPEIISWAASPAADAGSAATARH